MAVEKMKLMKLSGSLEQLSFLSEKICACACFQPDAASKYISASMGFVPFVEENPYASALAQLHEIAKSAGFSLSLCEENANGHPFDEEDRAYLDTVKRKVTDLYATQSALLEQKAACETGIEKYTHFQGMEVDLDALLQCEFVKVRFGHLPKESYQKLQTVFADNPYVLFYPCSEDKTDYWGVYFAPADRINEIDGIFAFLLFEPFEVPGAAGTVDEIMAEFRHSIDIIGTQLENTTAQLHALWVSEKERCNRIYTDLVRQNAVYELRSYALHNDKYFMLVGYVPASEESRFRRAVEAVGDVQSEAENPPLDGKTQVPVKMKTGFKPLKFLVEPYKYYVDMYGTPAYTDIDITPFVAITYTILFGMMFGDLGQGAVLALVGFLMWKLKKMDLGKILIPCGIASMCFGFLFGSVFGYEEMLDPVYRALGWGGKPISVMDSINTVLLAAIAIGVGLMVVAMLLNIYACLKRKKFGEALFSQNGVVGLLMYLAGCNLASGFMGGPKPLPNSVAGIILGVTAVLLMFKEIPIGIIDKHPDWKPDSIIDFVLQNLFELLEYVLSYLSNTVSFLRVGAFVLVHAGMMMVVFSLAGENENLFVIILGNILVIALEGLLTGIQALRLEYYEMFSRFFEGGGKAFVPTTLKEKESQS